jgi:hypothetical protein
VHTCTQQIECIRHIYVYLYCHERMSSVTNKNLDSELLSGFIRFNSSHNPLQLLGTISSTAQEVHLEQFLQ